MSGSVAFRCASVGVRVCVCVSVCVCVCECVLYIIILTPPGTVEVEDNKLELNHFLLHETWRKEMNVVDEGRRAALLGPLRTLRWARALTDLVTNMALPQSYTATPSLVATSPLTL